MSLHSPSQNSLFVNGPPQSANTRPAEGTSSRDRLSAGVCYGRGSRPRREGLMVELSQARSCTSVAPAMLAQWAQQYRDREPFASTPWPMILTPQCSQVGARSKRKGPQERQLPGTKTTGDRI